MFSWVPETDGHRLVHASHRWYSPEGRLFFMNRRLVEQPLAVDVLKSMLWRQRAHALSGHGVAGGFVLLALGGTANPPGGW